MVTVVVIVVVGVVVMAVVVIVVIVMIMVMVTVVVVVTVVVMAVVVCVLDRGGLFLASLEMTGQDECEHREEHRAPGLHGTTGLSERADQCASLPVARAQSC